MFGYSNSLHQTFSKMFIYKCVDFLFKSLENKLRNECGDNKLGPQNPDFLSKIFLLYEKFKIAVPQGDSNSLIDCISCW